MEEGQDVLIAGLHDVRLALGSQPPRVVEVWVDARRDDRRMADIVALAKNSGVRVNRVPRRDLERLADGLRHQGVVARCSGVETPKGASLESFLANLRHDPLLLILDGVQDPHNLGACMRTADGAGVDAVVVPQDRACGITAVVSRVAAGAVHSTPLFPVVNLERSMQMMKERGIWMTGAADDAPRSVYECDLAGPAALVLGAEGAGLRELTRRRCDFLARIPMQGAVESLNVSVAAGVLLYEALRQRSRPGNNTSDNAGA